MKKVFISYAHSDRYRSLSDKSEKVNNIVTKVIKFCDDNRITRWSDDVHLPGDKYEKLIREHINDCEFFLFISSIASNSSEYCRKEIDWAIEFGKTILPLKVEDCRLCAKELSDFHAIEYFNQDKCRCWKDLGEKLLDENNLGDLKYPEELQRCSIWVTSDMDCSVSASLGKIGTTYELHKNKRQKIGILYYTGNPIELQFFSHRQDKSIEFLKTLIIDSDDCQLVYAISVKLLEDYNKKRCIDEIHNLPIRDYTNDVTQNVISNLSKIMALKFKIK